ncbi:hypothetical protein VNO78_24052 [Psophocarpus tetragonolobus]|uniref:Uncharacterized protein n=1 Tax=Psophocarpus tetragonolobus TaxID=3891 RepID=A0AAN9S5W4_PSOTE
MIISSQQDVGNPIPGRSVSTRVPRVPDDDDEICSANCPEEEKGTSIYGDGDSCREEVEFLAFVASPAAMTDLFNVSTANMPFTISQDLFCQRFQGVCFCFSSLLLCKLTIISLFFMFLV